MTVLPNAVISAKAGAHRLDVQEMGPRLRGGDEVFGLWKRILIALLIAAPTSTAATPPTYASVRPNTAITLPADHGAHPAFRTEWWYVTGWLRTAQGKSLGFQITFFRTRPPADQANPSAFAAKQIIFAHAAVSDPAVGHLLHDQRIARAGFGLAEAKIGDTDLVLGDWKMRRDKAGVWRAVVHGKGFALNLALTPTQPPLLQGRNGYSQKGPNPGEASHYFSVPHLKVSGSAVLAGKPVPVTGTAWLDREWSSNILNPRAVGWDWLGLNMNDGGALTLFQIRDASGAPVWAGGSWRRADGRLVGLAPADVVFTPGRPWHSSRTGARYPVAPSITVRLPGKTIILPVTPLFNDQELDSRRGGGPVYWEGAVTVPGGRGYLELTGYQAALKM